MSTPDPLNLQQKIGQLFMVGFEGESLDPETAGFISDNNIGFVILFRRNIRSVEQAFHLIADIHRLGKERPFVFVDQEGGTVVQFGELTSTLVSHRGLVAAGRPGYARTAGSIIGHEMSLLGVDGVFAPVLDVNREHNNPIIGIRSFSHDPGVVAKYGAAFARGLENHGIVACGKHFPGHGDTRVDSHRDLPVSDADHQSLDRGPLVPFRYLLHRGLNALMTAHIRYPNIDENPATFSRRLISDLLRRRWGFDGLVFTDCLEMQAVAKNFTPRQVVGKTMNSGADVLLATRSRNYQQDLMDTLYRLIREGRVPLPRIEESLARIRRFKKKYMNAPQKRHPVRPPAAGRIRSPENRRKEARIARKSITLQRNQRRVLPLDRHRRILLLEWEKLHTAQQTDKKTRSYMLRETLERIFAGRGECRAVCLDLDGGLPSSMIPELARWDYLLCGVYFRDPLSRDLQIRTLNLLADRRPDLIVVTLGNPFEPEEVPRVSTLVATYGFRQCQIDALFRRLTE